MDAVVGGRFRVSGVLGSGAVAHVLAAVEIATGRPVALKVPRPGDDGAALALLRREAEVLARAASRHLPALLGCDLDDAEAPWLALERLAPAPLDEDARLPWAEVARAVAEAAEALAALHAAGFVHCDVKPGNLLRGEGRLVLIDFNTALDVGGSTGGRFVGSARYMAPELWRGDPVSPATDAYGLAATAIALATGAAPFAGEGAVQLMRAHLEAAPPSLVSRGVAVAAAAEAAIAAALEKDAAARPDVRALARALAP